MVEEGPVPVQRSPRAASAAGPLELRVAHLLDVEPEVREVEPVVVRRWVAEVVDGVAPVRDEGAAPGLRRDPPISLSRDLPPAGRQVIIIWRG